MTGYQLFIYTLLGLLSALVLDRRKILEWVGSISRKMINGDYILNVYMDSYYIVFICQKG